MMRQRGVILISALILVALAAIVAASLFFETAMSARRANAGFSMEQALQLGEGAEALATYALSQDTNQQDTPGEDWSMPYGPVEVEKGITLEAQLTDETGKFNLNILVKNDGTPDANAVKVFKRLLELIGLETRWADLLVDWMDPDNLPVPGGAEDNTYTSRQPAHLAGNQPMTSITELLQLPDFSRAMYDKLVPHVTVLPPSADRINVCTADGIVLDSLYALSSDHAGYTEHSNRSAADWQQLRGGTGCFPSRAELTAIDTKLGSMTAERSSYFRLRTVVRIGSAEYALYSLLYRQGRQARAVIRSFGTE